MEQPNNNKPNIIFLDFDGVLVSMDYMNAIHFRMHAATKLHGMEQKLAHQYVLDKY